MQEKLNLTILYVEDETDIRESLAEWLGRRASGLLVATNGQEGLQLYQQHFPDIVITDIKMPVMNGLEMAREIRKISPKAQVVVISAHSDTEFFMDSIEIGIDQYVLKPIDTNKLAKALERCAEYIKLEKENKNYQTYLEQLVDKKTLENLELQKNAIIGDMISGFIHNLRSPLTVLAVQTDMLERKEKKLAEQSNEFDEFYQLNVKNRLRDMSCAIEKIDMMLENLSLKKRNDALIKKSEIDINNFIMQEIDFLMANTKFKHDVEKKLDLQPDLPTISIVPSDLSQVFYNLVNNSMDAMWRQSDKELTFITRYDGNYLQLIIEDNGPGIPAEHLPKLFDPFFTTKKRKDEISEPDEPSGTGLGLHSVRQLLQANDGEIFYESEAGKGTRAIVRFRKV